MISLLKKAKNIVSTQEKAWYTIGQIMIGGIFVYIALDFKNKLKQKPKTPIQEIISIQNDSDLEYSPRINNYSPAKLSKFVSASSKKVQKIVITGGPCSGKTTAMNSIIESLRNRGFKVYVTAEAASILHSGGANMKIEEYPELKQIKFQSNLLSLQMAIEDRITEVAMVECTNFKPGVIICNRGTMDGAAFISKEKFQAILNKKGENLMSIRDNRYDGIVHLVTTANGAPDFFKNDNSQQDAISIDNSLQEAWKAHPQFFRINNIQNQSFDQKIERAVRAAIRIVGLPQSVNFYKKYLLKSFDGEKGILELLPKELILEQTQIHDTFLITSDKEFIRKIRKRGSHECSSYMIIERIIINDEQASIKRRINSKNYYQMLGEKDEELNPLKKTRSTFIWKDGYFLIDEYKIYNGIKFSVLLIFVSEGDQDKIADLPPFLKIGIVRDITDEELYLPESIAKKNWKMPEEDYKQVIGMFSL